MKITLYVAHPGDLRLITKRADVASALEMLDCLLGQLREEPCRIGVNYGGTDGNRKVAMWASDCPPLSRREESCERAEQVVASLWQVMQEGGEHYRPSEAAAADRAI